MEVPKLLVFCAEMLRRSAGTQPRRQIAPVLQTGARSEIAASITAMHPAESSEGTVQTNIWGWKFLVMGCRNGFKALWQVILLH